MKRLDEMHADRGQGDETSIRAHYRSYHAWLSRQSHKSMAERQQEAEMVFRRVGITFAVYGDKDADGAGTERLIPFDLIPRIIPAHEWRELQRGLVQRVTALNRFIHDVYHDQSIIKAGLIPADMVLGNAQYRPQMQGIHVPGDVYSHISGIDIVRAPNAQGEGEYYVLEDNLRVPSGVSYMLEDRKMMMRLFPELFSMHAVSPVAHYPDLLLETLRASAPGAGVEPTVVVLTPRSSQLLQCRSMREMRVSPWLAWPSESNTTREMDASLPPSNSSAPRCHPAKRSVDPPLWIKSTAV